MLPKKHRLVKKKDFKLAFEKGTSYFSPAVNLVVSKNNDASYFLIGFIISNKVSKKAVVRNKIKRQMRAILRSFLSTLKGGGSLIFIAKKSLLDSNYHELERDIRTLLSKSKLV